MRQIIPPVLLTIAVAFPGCDAMTGSDKEVLLRFGAVADVQYCDCPYNAEWRIDYRASLPKLQRAVAMLNEAYDDGSIAFSIHLGDLIDRDSASFELPLAAWRTLNHDAFLVPGNHELGAFGDYDRAVQALGIKSETGRGYYSFTVARAPGWRFLVMDGNDASLSTSSFSPEYARGMELFSLAQGKNADTVWWSGGVSQDQVEWLETELDASQAAGERVVVFSHFPLGGTIGYDLWNADIVHRLFSRYDHIAGFFGGHYHRPYAVSGTSVPQIGVPSLLGRTDHGEWGIATVYADGHIRWEGRRLKIDAWAEEAPVRSSIRPGMHPSE